MKAIRLSVLFLIGGTVIEAQSRANDLAAILAKPLETPDVVSFQLRQYLYQRLPKLPSPASAQQWLAGSRRLRKHLVDDVIFHGWPLEWVDAAEIRRSRRDRNRPRISDAEAAVRDRARLPIHRDPFMGPSVSKASACKCSHRDDLVRTPSPRRRVAAISGRASLAKRGRET